MQYALEFEVPDGYRLPTKTDIVGDWKRFDAPNHLKDDFNSIISLKNTNNIVY